jgi:hypothetical protein
MPPTEHQNGASDFDPGKIATAVSKHDTDIIEVKLRLDTLEQKFEPAQIAAVLEGATEDSKKIDKLFSRLFCEMLQNDPDVKKSIGDHIRSSDRSMVYGTLKKWGGFVGAGLLFVAGLLTKAAIDYFMQ